jgi:hypothetical protein
MEITSSSSSSMEKANTISRRISPNNLRGLIGDIQPRPQSGDIAIVISANNLLDNPKYMVKNNKKMYCRVGKRFPHLQWGNSDGLFVKIDYVRLGLTTRQQLPNPRKARNLLRK